MVGFNSVEIWRTRLFFCTPSCWFKTFSDSSLTPSSIIGFNWIMIVSVNSPASKYVVEVISKTSVTIWKTTGLNCVRILRIKELLLGNVHKGRPTIMGHFGHTYLPMSDVFYTMPITLVRFLLRYLPTPKSDVLYERSLIHWDFLFRVLAPTLYFWYLTRNIGENAIKVEKVDICTHLFRCIELQLNWSL